MWEPNPRPYQVEVRDPEKKSKFKGIKSFIAYTIIPDVSESGSSNKDTRHSSYLHTYEI